MKLAPAGSTLWLLAHDLRIALRDFGGRRGSRRSKWAPVIRWTVIALAVLTLGAAAGVPLAILAHQARFTPGPAALLAIDAGLAILWTLMLSQALTIATQALYERNDLDLLLSSPLPPQRVLTVRALGVAVLAGAFYMALASVFVLPSLFLGEFRWLGVYVVLASLALCAAAAGLLLAMALFAVLGPKRTRTLAQILAALIGALVFLLAQARNFLPPTMRDALWRRIRYTDAQRFDVHAAYALPARAFVGEPAAMLAVTAFSLALFLSVTRRLGRRFDRDAAAAAGVSNAGVASPRRARRQRVDFRGGAWRMLVRKEARLLLRDPWLISQMLLQSVYILPLGFVIAKNARDNVVGALATGGAAAAFICGQLAGNLVWVTVSAEAAPELIACAPITAGQTLRAKLVVALTPVALLALAPLIVIASFSALAALIAAAGCLLAGSSSALLNLWWAKPSQRRDFRRRRSGAGLIGLVEVAALFGVGGATWLAIGANIWALAPLAFVLVLLAAMRRPVRLMIDA